MLAGDWRSAGKAAAPRIVEATRDLVVELADSGFVGSVVRIDGRMLHLEDRHGRVRLFPLGGGYLIDGESVALRAPRATAARPTVARTASGSIAATPARARVARAGRILVEGRHDAELVEKVWGADLRVEGVVVEYLEGVDHLAAALAEFRPAPGRRAGVLVDHLVEGSKEQRMTRGLTSEHVLVVGHPYVDVWQAVRPSRLGRERWPVIPKGTEWKQGICAELGWPHRDRADIARAWQRILGSVRDYRDLEPTLTGRVEQLIDFVTGE